MANAGQPPISLGRDDDAVKRLERVLRRTPDLGLTVDGIFGPQVGPQSNSSKQGAGLTVDAIVGPATWAALPDGGPMPTLQEGSTGAVVNSLQHRDEQRARQLGTQRRKGSTAISAAYESLLLWRFRPGPALHRMGLSATRPGLFPCMRRAPRWKQRWAYSS